MSCSKGIVYKHVAKGSQVLGEGVLVLCLLRSVTRILEEDHISVLHSLHSGSCVRSYHLRIGGEFHFLSEQLGKALRNRR